MSKIRHKLNLCDPCVSNKIISTKSHTLLPCADDVKASNVDLKIDDKFVEWSKLTCRSSKLGCMKVWRSEKYDYLETTIDYLTIGTFKVGIVDCINTMKECFPCQTNKNLKPWSNKIFHVDSNSSRLDKEKSDVFRVFTMKCVFLCKRRAA